MLNELGTDLDLIKKFRAPNTTSGSFRSFAHTWCGPHAIAKAAELLMNGQYVELHLCDHSINGNNTISVMTLDIENKSVRFSIDGDAPGRMCSADSNNGAEIAAFIACHLYSRKLEDHQSVYRQPSMDILAKLNEEND